MTLPDVRQTEDHGCGDAVLDAVFKFFGVKDRASLANAVQGMAPDTVEAVLWSAGFRVLSGHMTVRDLKHLTDSGRPVICPTAMYGGHWVVVCGVARLRVTFTDSAVPKDLPNPRTLPAAEWTAQWRDTSRSAVEYDKWGIAVSR